MAMKRYVMFMVFVCFFVWRAAGQVKVIAHRGYWKTSGSAQNSIRSMVKADSIGVYGGEFDVWLMADNCLAVNHDAIFKGVVMAQADSCSIKKIQLDNGETLPMLKEYLTEAKSHPDLRLILELKSLQDSTSEWVAAQEVVQLLKELALTERTDLISFSLHACLAFQKLLPSAKIFYLNGDLSPDEVKGLGLAGIDYAMNVLKAHPEWIQQAHALGMEVNVWTVNSPTDMEFFIKNGVDYITTDEPEAALSLLQNRQ